EEVERRCKHQVRDRQATPRQERLQADQAVEIGDAGLPPRERSNDHPPIRLPPPKRRADNAPSHHPRGPPPKEVPNVDADDLVHASGGPRVGWLERRLGKDVVEVAENCLCLVETKISVFEKRNTSEGVFLQIRLTLGFSQADRLQTVSCPLLMKAHLDAADKWASRHSVNDDVTHDAYLLPWRWRIRRTGPTGRLIPWG